MRTSSSGDSGLELSSTNGLTHDSYHGQDRTAENSDGLLMHSGSNSSRSSSSRLEDEVSSLSILRAVKGPAFCIFFTFFVTLSLFPSWTSHLRSIHQCDGSPGGDQESAPSSISKRLQNDLFTPFTFLLFNTGDLGGRLLAGQLPASRIPKQRYSLMLVVAACTRCIFFPLLVSCVSGENSSGNHARLQIESDVYSLTVQALLALSNGLLISLAFMHAPTMVPPTPASQEKSSEILSFSLSLGLLTGSLFSFPVTKLAMEL